MANELIFNVLMALIVAIIGAIARYLIPYLRTKKEDAMAALRQKNLDWLADIVDAVVHAVEQTVTSGIHGEEKKQIAHDYIKDLLKQADIQVSDEQISLLIEAAVKAMNDESKLVIEGVPDEEDVHVE